MMAPDHLTPIEPARGRRGAAQALRPEIPANEYGVVRESDKWSRSVRLKGLLHRTSEAGTP
jgi:hypothetical protein